MALSSYYSQSVAEGSKFQHENKSWAGFDVIKYKDQIKDLVDRYQAKTILDYGCGKGLQYTDPLPYAGEGNLQTFDQWLDVTVYKYDPCVPGIDIPPPPGTKFDGVICTQVLHNIPDQDMEWVANLLDSYTEKFCFISLNFQKPPKAKKMIYDPQFFKEKRTREFFRKHYSTWSSGDLFWWWKDRLHYPGWIDDQLSGQWQDVPAKFSGKYNFVEALF